MSKFHIGDKVCKKPNAFYVRVNVDDIGEVMLIKSLGKETCYLVNFEDYETFPQWIFEKDLVIYEPNETNDSKEDNAAMYNPDITKIEMETDNMTYVKITKNGTTAMAKCCPDDEFDIETGIEIAMKRLDRKLNGDKENKELTLDDLKYGDKYYSVRDDGEIEDFIYNGGEFGKYCFDSGNFFLNMSTAEKVSKEVKELFSRYKYVM